MSEKSAPNLEFSEKYDDAHAEQYFHKHQAGLSRRLSNAREIAMARKALRMAGNPGTVLDLPSGTGRFWEMLLEQPGRKIFAADYNQSMLDVAMKHRPAEITRQVETFQCSAFEIPKPDNFVDSVFCMRLIHHIGEAKDRIAILKEFARVASGSVIFTLWVDGNLQARRRKKVEARRSHKKYQNRFVVPVKQIEQDIADAGLSIAGHVDFLPGVSMWRAYVCRVTG